LGRPTSASATGVGRLRAGQVGQRRVEQVADALPVLRRDREGPVEAEAREVDDARLPRFGLVHDDEHALASVAQLAGDRLVVGQQARARVDHEEDEVGLLDGALGLLRRGAEQRVLAAEQQAAGVDDLESAALPGDLGVVAVPGRPGPAVGDRLAAAADAVEEGGLADVRPADERNSRERDHGRDVLRRG
jgi:hypothetical protein